MNKEKQDNIILLMIGFFMSEMCNSGITTNEKINDYFIKGNEKEFKKMIKEYKNIQVLTRNKAIKKVMELKKIAIKNDIKISQ